MSLPQHTDVKIKSKLRRSISPKTEQSKNWYVLYTAPRAEKVVKRELELKGYKVFLPVDQVLRVWKNRQKKVIDQVLFPSYIFVYTEENKLAETCWISKVKTYIQCGGRPSKIEVNCIEGIKRMLDVGQDFRVQPDFVEGEQVRIVKGPLAGYEGILIRQKSKTRFGIHLKEINQTVSVEVCTNAVEKIPVTQV
jgi:transcription antitermination factor NusG